MNYSHLSRFELDSLIIIFPVMKLNNTLVLYVRHLDNYN